MSKILSIVSLVCVVLLFWGGLGAYSSRSFQDAWNLGHMLLFAALTILVLKGSKTISNWQFFKQLWVILATVLAFGLIIEFGQLGMDSRTPDLFDILCNIIGSLFALVFFSPSRKHIRTAGLHAFQIVVTIAIALCVLPLAVAIADEIIASALFPVLSDFETPFEKRRWSGGAGYTIEAGHARHEKQSLKIVLRTTRYSGVDLNYFPADWRDYDYLKFSVLNASGEPLDLVCRIHDDSHYDNGGEYHDRFNKRLPLHQGWNDIAIQLVEVENSPSGRKMDLQHIQTMGIFSMVLPRERIIYLDFVRLE